MQDKVANFKVLVVFKFAMSFFYREKDFCFLITVVLFTLIKPCFIMLSQ